jgi:hypothetical protein
MPTSKTDFARSIAMVVFFMADFSCLVSYSAANENFVPGAFYCKRGL